MAANTVVIACKMPHGIWLSVTPEGGIEQRVRLNGSRLRYDTAGVIIQSHEVVNGYGLTRNVDAAFWEAWQKANKDFPAFKNGLILAHKDVNSARDEAANLNAYTTTGLEPIDPTKKADMDNGAVETFEAA